ncbi:MAG: hypothetical protein P4L53_17675 [Candidatus Obscuribacterales bacterium]|jgi:hypothetical protein|nr:hypothetical protein [Candidatus Obscuribacterales bacterium]
MQENSPITVSHANLLDELQTRVESGWLPDDFMYFSEMVVQLVNAYKSNNYRVVYMLEQMLAMPPAESPGDTGSHRLM